MTDYISLSTATSYPNTGSDHDIHFVDGVLQTVTDAEAVAQRVRQHLEFFQGEWFLNTDAGVPWFQFIFVEPFDQSTAESILKAEIVEIPGVAEISEFMVSVDSSDRSFNLDRVVIRTEFDQEVRV